MRILNTVFSIISILLVPNFSYGCGEPGNPHKPAFAHIVDVDTAAVFFKKNIGDATLASVLVAVGDVKGGSNIGIYATIDDTNYGVEGVDANMYSATLIHASRADTKNLTLWASYNPPAVEGKTKSLCRGPTYSYRLSELLSK